MEFKKSITYHLVGRFPSGESISFKVENPTLQPELALAPWQGLVSQFRAKHPEAIIISCEKLLNLPEDKQQILQVWYNPHVLIISPESILPYIPQNLKVLDVLCSRDFSFFSVNLGFSLQKEDNTKDREYLEA